MKSIDEHWKERVDAGWTVDAGSQAVEEGWIDATTFPEEIRMLPPLEVGAPAIPRSWERPYEYRSRQYRLDVLYARRGTRRHAVVTAPHGRLVPR